MRGQMAKAKAALEISDWSMVMVVQTAGENASQCYDQLQYPYYDILKAYFYFQASRLYLREQPPNAQQATLLNAAAKNALSEAAKYNLPTDQSKLLASAKMLARQTLTELTSRSGTLNSSGPTTSNNGVTTSSAGPANPTGYGSADIEFDPSTGYEVVPNAPHATARADDSIIITFCKEFQDSPSPGLASYTITFVNVSASDATAVEIDVEYSDAFGEPVYTAALQKKGLFSTGVSITAEYGGLDAPPYSTVRCYVKRALFDDGTLLQGQ